MARTSDKRYTVLAGRMLATMMKLEKGRAVCKRVRILMRYRHIDVRVALSISER